MNLFNTQKESNTMKKVAMSDIKQTETTDRFKVLRIKTAQGVTVNIWESISNDRRTFVDISEHNVEEGISIKNHNRRTVFADESPTGKAYEVSDLQCETESAVVTTTSFHKEQ